MPLGGHLIYAGDDGGGYIPDRNSPMLLQNMRNLFFKSRSAAQASPYSFLAFFQWSLAVPEHCWV